jgi:HEAT repeat protein
VSGLIGALKHKDSQVRWRAASALGFFQGEAVVDGLIEALRDREALPPTADRHSYVRRRAAIALAGLKRKSRSNKGIIQA